MGTFSDSYSTVCLTVYKTSYAELFVALAPDEMSTTFAVLCAAEAMATGGLFATSYIGLLISLALSSFSTTPYAGLFIAGAAEGS